MKKFFGILILIITITAGGYIYFSSNATALDDLLAKFKERNVEVEMQSAGKKSADPVSVRVPILVYHSVKPYSATETDLQKVYDVEPVMFLRQMQYLKDNGYAFINFKDLADYFNAGKKLPKKSVIVSLDDGTDSQYAYAFPILKQVGATATFFIFTNAIGHKHFLTLDQIKEMDAAGMSIGSHSKTHPYLFKITDDKELRKEIVDSKKILESKLGHEIYVFAYPFYRHTDENIKIVKEAGYLAARGGKRIIYNTKNDLFALNNIQVGDNMKTFIAELSK